MPRSQGRGFRSHPRIASRPGGVSSRTSSSAGSGRCSSERRLRIDKRRRRYPTKPLPRAAIFGSQGLEFRPVTCHVTKQLTDSGGSLHGELVSAQDSDELSLCLSDLRIAELVSVQASDHPSLCPSGLRMTRAGVRPGLGWPELVSVQDSGGPRLCLSEFRISRACVCPTFGSPEPVSFQTSDGPSLCLSKLRAARTRVFPGFGWPELVSVRPSDNPSLCVVQARDCAVSPALRAMPARGRRSEPAKP